MVRICPPTIRRWPLSRIAYRSRAIRRHGAIRLPGRLGRRSHYYLGRRAHPDTNPSATVRPRRSPRGTTFPAAHKRYRCTARRSRSHGDRQTVGNHTELAVARELCRNIKPSRVIRNQERSPILAYPTRPATHLRADQRADQRDTSSVNPHRLAVALSPKTSRQKFRSKLEPDLRKVSPT